MTAAVSFTSRRTAMSPATARKQAGTETIAKGGKQDDHHHVRGRQIDVTHVAQLSEAEGAESDVDELVDSDTERASEAAAKAAVVKTTSKSSKATKSGGAITNAAKKSGAASTTPTKKPSSGTQKEHNNDFRSALPSSSTTMTAMMGAEGNADGSKHPNNSSNVKDREAQHVQRRDSPSSRESLGRTATGGAVPYYYPQSGPQNGRQTASPSNKNASKRPLASKEASSTSMPRNAVAVKEEDAHGGGRDLTPEEVDKFLALIEKYDLDTTNDDDMARSVTEVYQEWLEWCAKRNVKSSKSKQALVSEFPKLYNGHYGNEYQERAMGIVQRQQEARALAANGVGSGKDAGYMRDRGGGSAGGGGVYSSAPDAAPPAVDRATAQRPMQPLPSSSTLRSSPNGANLRQAGRPDAGYMHAAHEIPPSVLESMHIQIRDEIWREANVMLNQIVHERFVEVAAEAYAMASRIEQLEVHSDNLAQWVQHLNRVQEDLQQHSFGAQPPPPPPGHMSNRPPYDDVIADESGRPRQPYMGGASANGPPPPAGAVGGPPSAGPSYHPAAHGGPAPHAPVGAYGAPVGSPRHRYSGPMRRSMTPPRSHYGAAPPPPMHGAPYHEAYDRHDVPPPPHHHPSHPMAPHQQHPAYHSSPHPHPAAGASGGPIDRHVSYHDDHPSRGGPPPPPGVPMHGGGGGPVKGGGGMHPPAGGYEGRPMYGNAPYHPPARDDRPHARRPESPASSAGMDSRHAKRPRNSGGGGVY